MKKNTCTTGRYPCDRDVCDGTHTFAMFSLAGEHACQKLIDEIRAEVEAGMNRKTLPSRLSRGMAAIAKKHPEVWDTAVREILLDKFDEICQEQGWLKYGYMSGDHL